MANEIPVDRQFDAFQEFVLGCKLNWTRKMFPELRKRYQAAVDADRAAGRATATSPKDVEKLLANDTTYKFFAWYERHLQRMKYSGRHGLAPHYAQHRDALVRELDVPTSDRLLQLDPNFKQPDYYVSIDIHQHPGGVWSDEVAGYVYERGAKSTAPLLDKAASLHHRLTSEVLARAGRPVKNVVDLGCGFGGSTQPFYVDHPEIDVVGVELSEPCLRLAARRAAEEQARNVAFRQADAASTGLESGRFDVVTSTMMLHEMPPNHIEKVVKEAYRLLSPGGTSIHLDFLTQDPFKTFIHYGHSKRNNEPFMPPLNEMDIAASHRRAGFEDVEILPFEEMPGTLSPEFTAWRFPWTLIIARKPA
jgi:ubiquinone/menaquinone biosynthesis C-methylase UbiE